MPIEKTPTNPLPSNYVPSGGSPYRVKDGDDWYSVARQFSVDVDTLIRFNFQTRNPDEVNWYLRRNVGCRKPSADGNNWSFSADARPGIVYIPPKPASRIKRLDVAVGAISWISAKTHPLWTSAQGLYLDPDWIPKTYLGLVATANKTPPVTIADFAAYRKTRDFRAMMYCHFLADIEENTGRITAFKVQEVFHDEGWTPPFNCRDWPAACVGEPISERTFSTWSGEHYRGEGSTDSLVNTQARHRNSGFRSSAGEQVLVNGVIKFRAGAHTDNIGIKGVGAPYHVPWVWCEMLLTYSKGKLKLHGQGSMFVSVTRGTSG